MKKVALLLITVLFLFACPGPDDVDKPNDPSNGNGSGGENPVGHKVSFDYANGSEIFVIQMEPNTSVLTEFPEDPVTGSSQYGDNFLGWFTVAQSQADYYDVEHRFDFSDIISSDITVYAHYSTKPVFKVEFDSAGGTPETYSAQYIFEGEGVVEPANAPVKPFQVLDAWTVESVPVDFTTFTVSADVTLQATYRNYLITFDVNGGKFLDDSTENQIFSANGDGMLADPIPQAADTCEIEGTDKVNFGWFLSEEGVLGALVNEQTVFSGDTTCLLNWVTDAQSANVGTLVAVSGGSFHWYEGAPDTEMVTVTPYYICDKEVTQETYANIMGENPSYFTDPDQSRYAGNGFNPFTRSNTNQRPVDSVTFYQAVQFCNQLSITEGFDPVYTVSGDSVVPDLSKNGYRLPTEAQWLWAAMSAEDKPERAFSGRESGLIVGNYSWHRGNCYDDNPWTMFQEADFGTKPVGSKNANALGLYDMSGNVWEWVFDYYGDRSFGENPCCTTAGVYRVLKGGSWHTDKDFFELNYRKKELPTFANYLYGIRVVRGANS